MNRLITLMFHDIFVSSPDESGFSGQAAARYKLSLDALRRQLRAAIETRSDAPVLVTDLARPAAPLLPFAISVDDGGLSYYTLLVPCLQDLGWLGHCMVTTGRLGKPGFLHPHHVRELHAAGHLIGTHSVTHPQRFHRLSWDQMVAEWSQSRSTLEDLIGERVRVGSIPGGYYSRQVVRAAGAAGLDFLFSSEPETTTRMVDSCQVFGRFTLRRDSSPDRAGRLLQAGRSARTSEWLAWNSKKVLKKSLGARFAQVSDWLARQASDRVSGL